MQAWIFFLLCLAGKALAAPQEDASEDMYVVAEEPVTEEPVGVNPVQVEVGEFEEPAVDVEEVVSERKWSITEYQAPLPQKQKATSHMIKVD
ncbi:UNVERIFIED_CONTAM: hypothetical protein K2H54_037018 [Gekko kuhli]